MPRPPEKGEHGERDGDPDPGQDADKRHTERRHHCEYEVGAMDAEKPAQRREVDEPRDGGDDHCGERRGRQVPEQTRRKHERETQPQRGDHPGELRARAGCFRHRCPGRAARDGETLEKPRGHVASPECQQLLILVDPVTELRRVAARQHPRVRERDERDRDRGECEPIQVGNRRVRNRERRQALGHGPDRGYVIRNPEQRYRPDREGHGHEHARHARREVSKRHDH